MDSTSNPMESASLRVRLDISYDGTQFAGWARQPGLRTVQGELEAALATIFRCGGASAGRGGGGADGGDNAGGGACSSDSDASGPHGGGGSASALELTVAGRTDAGVHARGQVAHFDVPRGAWDTLPGRGCGDPADALVRRLNGVLARRYSVRSAPPSASGGREPRGVSDVVVHRAEEVPVDFDARFSALRRRYAYRIADGMELRDPLRRTDVLWHRRRLDVAAMNEAAALLVGEHDFAAYCKPREGATTIRELQVMSWRRVGAGWNETVPSGSGQLSGSDVGEPTGLVIADVRADAFCHSMVRALVGACLAVGEGRQEPTWPLHILTRGRRDPGVTVAPAHGLTLEEVTYPATSDLAARAELTRQVRSLGGAGNPP